MKGQGNAKALPCLHKLVTGDDSQIRMYAAISLGGIQMKESTGPLLAALKKENKDRVRSHLARAIFACCNDEKTLRGVTLQLIKSNAQLDQIVGLYHATLLKPDADELSQALLAIDEREGRGEEQHVTGHPHREDPGRVRVEREGFRCRDAEGSRGHVRVPKRHKLEQREREQREQRVKKRVEVKCELARPPRAHRPHDAEHRQHRSEHR